MPKLPMKPCTLPIEWGISSFSRYPSAMPWSCATIEVPSMSIETS